MKNDDFDIIAKKKLKLTPVIFDKNENGFDGIFRDKNNNLVIIIKKSGKSIQGFGLEFLLNNEGSMDWVNEILRSGQNAEISKEINQAINDQKLRCVLIYHKIDTSIFIVSEYDQNEGWKYIDAVKYYLNRFWKNY